MGRRRHKGREVSGWLAFDKAVGQTSTHAVASVKRLLGAAKAGHAGTLDPLASGILPIAVGDATKTVPFVQEGRKLYRFTVRFGAETDTDDAEGRIVARSDRRADGAAIAAALAELTGDIMQRPPSFSALKIAGERAYDLAREGAPVVLEERPVTVHRLELLDIPDAETALIEAECGKGTYVRALARDLGRRLGSLGHVLALRRLAVGPFDTSISVTLETLIAAREAGTAETLDRFLLPIGTALRDVLEIPLARPEVAKVRRGQPVLLRGRDVLAASGPAHATLAGETLAIGEIDAGMFHPRKVFRLDSRVKSNA